LASLLVCHWQALEFGISLLIPPVDFSKFRVVFWLILLELAWFDILVGAQK
jgi:hypothetical protein